MIYIIISLILLVVLLLPIFVDISFMYNDKSYLFVSLYNKIVLLNEDFSIKGDKINCHGTLNKDVDVKELTKPPKGLFLLNAIKVWQVDTLYISNNANVDFINTNIILKIVSTIISSFAKRKNIIFSYNNYIDVLRSDKVIVEVKVSTNILMIIIASIKHLRSKIWKQIKQIKYKKL